MDEPSSQEPSKEEEVSKSLDLSALQSFSFGTQWTEAPKQSKGASNFRPRSGGSRPPRGDRPDRRQGGAPVRKDRRPQRSDQGNAGGSHGDARNSGSGQDRRSGGRGRHQGGGRGQGRPQPFNPYESPVFDVCFYPDDNCFSAIIKAMRGNHLTYELFQVAKLFMEKPDRFIASITRKTEKGEKAEKVIISTVDNMPCASEEDAILHAFNNYADTYFTIEEVEIDPPSGNFPFVNRCPFTKELLGPPNYHKYEEALRDHHRTRMANMSFEKLQSSIETVRDEEVVKQWLDSQTKTNRYTTKVAEGEEAKSFDSVEAATNYFRIELKDKLVKEVSYARVSGAILEKFIESEAYKAMNGERERQQRFPLDTANAIRGRMRREKFSIYKRGAKGVTYVCSTKRNFRLPEQVMSPELDRVIRFLEANPMKKAKEFAAAFEEWLKTDAPNETYDEKKLTRDLHWLIADGYVSHFENDELFAQPILDSGGSKPAGEKKKKAKKKPAATDAVKETAKQEKPVEAPADKPVAEEETETPVEPVAEVKEAPAPVEPPAQEPASETTEPEPEATVVESEPVEAPTESTETAPEPEAKEDVSGEPEENPKAEA